MIQTLGLGDSVFHPKFGFGVVEGLKEYDPADVGRGSAAGHAEDYYDIRLLQGGSLLVPAARADGLGLRRLANGVAVVQDWLRSAPESLPDNGRERAAVLRARSQGSEAGALARTVRDLLARGRSSNLSASDRLWLDKSYELLSREAALVDGITVSQARAAILQTAAELAKT